jgi:hypothetical protein
MNDQRSSRRMLLLGLVVSLVLHGLVLVPAMIHVMTGDPLSPNIIRAQFSPEDFMEPVQEPAPEADDAVRLGIDESTESTMTWIGYEEYEEHLATLAETEQAAFTTDPTGGPPAQPSATPAPPAVEPAPATDAPQDEPGAETDPLAEFEAWLQASAVGEGPPVGDPTDPAARSKALEDVLANLERMLNESVVAEPVQEAAPPQPPQPEPTPPQPPQPAETNAPPTPPGAPGDQADQESDATSTVEVPLDNIKLGKPLAAKGLRLKPRKPEFTTLTQLTAAPGNPLVELQFRRDGKPQRVRIIEGSGDARIDEAILNSLYRWRAAGKELKALKRGELLPIQIRIVLSSR